MTNCKQSYLQRGVHYRILEEIPTEAIFLVGLKVLVVIKALHLHGSVQVPAEYAASYHIQSGLTSIPSKQHGFHNYWQPSSCGL